MKNENEILDKYAKQNPFNVPEGYFENLTEEIMQKLPPQDFSYLKGKKPTLWQQVRPWCYMAAMFCGIIFAIHALMNFTSDNDNAKITESAKNTDEYVDQLADYSMIGDYDTYCYLTSAE